MEEAFGRLTAIQQKNINMAMFVFVYGCIVKSKGSYDAFVGIVSEEIGTSRTSDLECDIMRYYKLVQKVM